MPCHLQMLHQEIANALQYGVFPHTQTDGLACIMYVFMSLIAMQYENGIHGISGPS